MARRTQYMFPLKCTQLMNQEKLPRIETSVSVRNHLLLLIMTAKGENQFDSEYGTSLWENDFDVIVTENSWSTEMSDSLTKSIKINEPRITDNFRVLVKLDKGYSEDNPSEVREKFIIHISGLTLIETNEQIPDVIHTVIFSPLNVD